MQCQNYRGGIKLKRYCTNCKAMRDVKVIGEMESVDINNMTLTIDNRRYICLTCKEELRR